MLTKVEDHSLQSVIERSTIYNHFIMASLVDLFEFLDSPNPSARHLALQNLIGHTAKNDPQRHIFIPSSLAGAGGGGLLPEKRKQGSEEDQVKIKALKDLCALCQDQAVS
jgi:hypothetical protein